MIKIGGRGKILLFPPLGCFVILYEKPIVVLMVVRVKQTHDGLNEGMSD